MFDLYFDETINVAFVRHFDEFERAEHVTALQELMDAYQRTYGFLAETPNLLIPTAVWLDTKDVVLCSLRDTDSAFRAYAMKKFEDAGVLGQGIKLARVLYPESTAYESLLERANKTFVSGVDLPIPTGAIINTGIPTFNDVQAAKRYCEVPQDYDINWTKMNRL